MSDDGAPASVSRRVIALLRLFADGSDSLSIAEIAERLSLPPSTVHRLLVSLVEERFVERAARRRYAIGQEFSRIGAIAARRLNLRSLARPHLHEVQAATGETSVLGALLDRPPGMMIADKVDAVHTLRYRVPINVRRPLLWGSLGRAMLAWLEPEDVQAAHAGAGNAPGSGDPPPSAAALAGVLERVRRLGYAVSHGQAMPGAVGLAAPIFDAESRVVGAIGLTVPEFRFRRRDEARLAALLTERASRLSFSLGARRSVEPPPARTQREALPGGARDRRPDAR